MFSTIESNPSSVQKKDNAESGLAVIVKRIESYRQFMHEKACNELFSGLNCSIQYF